MSPAASPITTPKRKRGELVREAATSPSLRPTKVSFAAPSSSSDDGSNSPRTKVAQKFRGLAIADRHPDLDRDSGSGSDAMHEDGDIGVRKRMKLPEVNELVKPNAHETRQLAAASPAPELEPVWDAKRMGKYGNLRAATHNKTVAFHPKSCSPTGIGASESSEASEDSDEPRKPRRATTAIHLINTKLARKAAATTTTSIVDPIRAALTWQADEITVYDPDDSADDGTGMNGIGFKPTPAVAYAREVKRKNQLAEYRKREEREARAWRSLRRRGAASGTLSQTKVEGKGKGNGDGVGRRVRFLEG